MNSLQTLAQNIETIYPLSPIQQGMLFHTLMQPNSGIYLQQYRYVMTMKELNISAFKQAWQAVVNRHQMLRTAFVHEAQEQPLQVVFKDVEMPFEFQDWRHLSAQEQQDQVEQILAEERQQGLAFHQAPLMAVRLIQLDDERYQFIRSYHHILMDAWCFSLIMVEFLQYYRHYANNQALSLTPAPQYQDYIAWLEAQDHTKQQSFWQEKLSGFNAPTPLGIEQTNRFNDEHNVLSKDVICHLTEQQSQQLQQIAQQYQVTLNTLLQGAWAQTLARYSQQSDVVFGVTVAGRSIELANIEHIVGLFINTLPLRCQTSSESNLAQWLQDLQQENLALREYEQTSLASIQQWSDVEDQPLFNSIFVYENAPMDQALDRDKLEFSVEQIENRSDLNYPLTVTVLPQEQLHLELTYRCSDFERQAVSAMLEHFKQILINISQLAQPLDATLAEVEPSYSLQKPQTHQVLVGQQQATLASAPELFAELASQQPQAIAVTDHDNQLSYQQLDQQSNALACHLINHNQVKPNQLIGLCLTPSSQMLVAMLAIMKAGAAYVPLDPNYPATRLEYMINDAELSLIIGEQSLVDHQTFIEHQEKLLLIDDAEITQLLSQNSVSPDVKVKPTDLAYVIYTSGTTGQPKGVMVEHQQLSNFLTNAKDRYSITNQDKVLQFSTINFDISVEECFGALCFGAELAIRSEDCLHDPVEFFRFCQQHQVSIASLPTAFWHQLVSYQHQQLADSLRLIIVGGEALQVSLVNHWFNYYQGPELVNTYGPTEATVTACGYHLNKAYQENGEIPIGTANINTQLYIFDQQLRQVPLGTIGELYIGGPSVARGYLNQPTLTTERFIQSPFNNQERLYRTGDLVRLNHNGELEFNGRIDDQVKIRGYRIELSEIETVLQQQAEIKQCLVTTWQKDNGDKAIIAYFTSDNTLSEQDLRQQLSEQLAEYMLPSAFVQLAKLPLTVNGKIDKKALPAPIFNTQQANNNYLAARTQLEQTIVETWQKVLGVEKIGIKDNFFHLGGHSLLVIKVIGSLKKQNIHIDAAQLFKTPTPEQLAQSINQNIPAEITQSTASLITEDCQQITNDMLPLVELSQQQLDLIVSKVPQGIKNIQDIYPLAPLQEGLLFHHMLAPEDDPYIVKALFEVNNRSTFDRLVDGLNFIIQRHDILRSQILWRQLDQPVQVVNRRAQLQVEWLELDHNSDLSATNQTLDICQRMQQYQEHKVISLDLEQAPLLQLKVAKDQLSDKHAVMFIEHHIISDHVSVDLIIKELKAYLTGNIQQLPTSVPYRNFVVHARQQNQQQAQAYFSQQLSDINQATLPYGLNDVQGNTNQLDQDKSVLTDKLAQKIRQLSKQNQTSPASFFHGAWALMVARASAYSDVVFGTVMSGRLQNLDHADAMLGLFINTLPLRVNLTELTAKQLLKHAQESLQALIPYEQSSLALAQRCSQLPAEQPLFSALLNYRHSNLMTEDKDLAEIKLLEVNEPSNYPFTLSVDDYGDDFGITLEIDQSLDCQKIRDELLSVLALFVEQLESDNQQAILTSYLSSENQQKFHWHKPAPMKFAQSSKPTNDTVSNTETLVVEKAQPVTENEHLLVEIWQQVLILDNIGREDNFFELGGHSLLIMQVITKLQQRNINLSASQLFKTPVLSELAKHLEQPSDTSEQQNDQLLASIPENTTVIKPEMLPLISLNQQEIDLIIKQVPGGIANLKDIYPLAPLQQGILFHHRMEQEQDPYVMPAYLKITGSKNFNLFINGLQQIIERHDTLRTAILWENLSQPVQVVCRHVELPIQWLELDQKQDLLEQMQDLEQTEKLSVNLKQAPLLSITAAHNKADDEYVIRILDHHIISDHVSMVIIQKELALIFANQAELLPTPVQYRQFIAQLNQQQEQQKQSAQQFFTQQLEGFTEPSQPFALSETSNGRSVNELDHWLSNTLNQQVRATAKQLKINPATLFHSAYAMVIAACSNKDDIAFGTVMSGRLQGITGTENMMGMFINTLPVRLKLTEVNAHEFVQQTQQALLALLPYEQTPLTEVQQHSELSAETPLFSALLNYRHTEKASQSDHQLAQLKFIDPKERTNYPLAISVDDYSDSFLINTQVENNLNAKLINDYLITALAQLVQQLDEQSDTPILHCSILPPEEQIKLLTLNQNLVKYPDNQCIYHLLEQQVEQSSLKTALVFEQQSLSYQEFNTKVNQLAHYLQQQGIVQNDYVALYLERSLEMVIAIWAVMKAGAAYLPIDTSLPSSRVNTILDDSKAKLLLSQQQLNNKLTDVATPCILLNTPEVQEELTHQPSNAPQLIKPQSPRSSAYLIYTSGSTGQPKGVICTHQGLVNRVDWMQKQYQLTPSDRVLQKTPYSFDVSVWEFVWPLITGATLVIAKPEGHKNAEYLTKLIHQQQITHLHFVPSMLHIMLNQGDWRNCQSVKQVFCSGEALSYELQESFFTTQTQAQLHNLYGPTEAAIDVSYWQCQANSKNKTVPIGKPIQNTQLLILDRQQKLVPFGSEGELYIGGVGLAQGYLNKPQLTQERFIPSPFKQIKGKLYRTGDLVRYLPDGNIDYIGRLDHQVKIRGLRIELGEIEHQLNLNKQVNSAQVTVKLDAKGEQHLVAYLQTQQNVVNQDDVIAELKQQLNQHLPSYMVPALYLFVEQWPLTSSGKIDKKALPEPSFSASTDNFIAANTDIEHSLVKIWAKLLQLTPEQISTNSNFFELGGHSILAMKLISEIEAEFNLSLSLQNLFSSPTIATIAEQVSQHQDTQDNELDLMEQLLNEFEEQI